jgi:hypothetical protein
MAIMKPILENMKNLAVFVKNNSTLVVLFALGLAFIGCGRCQECKYDAGGSETLCETEFDTPSQYEAAIDEAESNGAQCTASGGI